MTQLILHLIGDYVTQSDWMAQNKVKATLPAAIHACVYSMPFAWIASWPALTFILVTHFVIDRFRVAKYVVFAKNFLGWPWPTWEDCKDTGYPSVTPSWLAVWLMIIADNTMHLVCNYFAIVYWGGR